MIRIREAQNEKFVRCVWVGLGRIEFDLTHYPTQSKGLDLGWVGFLLFFLSDLNQINLIKNEFIFLLVKVALIEKTQLGLIK